MGVSEVDALICPAAYSTGFYNTQSYGYVNDSVEIKGNGVKMYGEQRFVTSGGLITPLDSSCPSTPTSTDVIVSHTYGFLYIDGPNVNVTIQNMTIFEHEYILRTTSDCDNCSIILDSVNATRIIPIVSCLSSAIELSGDNIHLDVLNNHWDTMWSYEHTAPAVGGYYIPGAIQIFTNTMNSNSSLYVADSSFRKFGDEYGNTYCQGKVNIVSSLFVQAGGMTIESTQASNIVNTAWINSFSGQGLLEPQDRFYNRGSGQLNFISSTLFYTDVYTVDGLVKIWDLLVQ